MLHFTALCSKHTLTDIPLTPPTGHREISEVGPTGPAAAGTQAGHPAEAGSITEAFPTVPAEASALTTAPSKTAEAKEDHLTMEGEAPPNISTRSITLSHPAPSNTSKSQLYTDRAPDGHGAFHTTLQLVTKQGC